MRGPPAGGNCHGAALAARGTGPKPRGMNEPHLVANGEPRPLKGPATIEQFLIAQGLLPRSVVVEHNGEAVAPSEFATRALAAGDRLEIVRVVAGG